MLTDPVFLLNTNSKALQQIVWSPTRPGVLATVTFMLLVCMYECGMGCGYGCGCVVVIWPFWVHFVYLMKCFNWYLYYIFSDSNFVSSSHFFSAFILFLFSYFFSASNFVSSNFVSSNFFLLSWRAGVERWAGGEVMGHQRERKDQQHLVECALSHTQLAGGDFFVSCICLLCVCVCVHLRWHVIACVCDYIYVCL